MTRITAASCLCADIFDSSGEILPGGEALNFAASIAHFGHVEAEVMGAIADDPYGEEIIDAVGCRRIGRRCLHVIPGGVTANNRIYLTDGGDRYFKADSWTGGVYSSFTLGEDDLALLAASDIVHLNHSSPVFWQILELKERLGFRLSADFNEESRHELLKKAAPYMDFFFISAARREMEMCRLLESFSARYDGIFIATFAEKGSSAFHCGARYDTCAVPVNEVVDTTGCGDSYQAGFIGEYTRSDDIVLAMRRGSEMAAMTLSHTGGLN